MVFKSKYLVISLLVVLAGTLVITFQNCSLSLVHFNRSVRADSLKEMISSSRAEIDETKKELSDIPLENRIFENSRTHAGEFENFNRTSDNIKIRLVNKNIKPKSKKLRAQAGEFKAKHKMNSKTKFKPKSKTKFKPQKNTNKKINNKNNSRNIKKKNHLKNQKKIKKIYKIKKKHKTKKANLSY